MSSVIIAGDTSGTVTLAAPAVAGTTTLTLPATTGTVLTSATTQAGLPTNVAGNGPAFMAYNNTNQSISTATYTKVRFNVEEWDTNSNFDSTTNYRFTPTVAGYYQFSFGISTEPSGNTATRILTAFFKNGSEYKMGNDIVGANVTTNGPVGSTLIYLNGSTDYVEVYIYINAGTPVIRGTSSSTWFSGFLARGA
jgi:hypothetical protein